MSNNKAKMTLIEENGHKSSDATKEGTSDSHVTAQPDKQSPAPSPKKGLKSISPYRNGNSAVGRLSFLQSDNIDDHFEHIHGSHDAIMRYLQLLEASTQQTSVDVGQLFDRSKNNNQNLNKLLSSIAEYSREVTEEGTATKTDVGKILDALHGVRYSKNEALANHYDAKHEETIREIRSVSEKLRHEELQKAASQNQSLMLNKLSAIEAQLAGLKVQNTFGEFRSRVESLAQENSKQVNAKLAEVLQSLQSLNLTEKTQNKDPLNGVATHISDKIEESMTRVESLVEAQTKTLERFVALSLQNRGNEDAEKKQAELQEKYDALSNKFRNLESSYSNLETKYSKLEYFYEAKLRLFQELQSKFASLGEESKTLESSINNFDASKYDKVQELHSMRVRDLRNVTPLQRSARVASMPPHNSSEVVNNSDIEE